MHLTEKAGRIKLLAMDVDGVLTDGSLFYGPEGEEIKVFNVRDGLGITLAHHAGLEIAIISGRGSEALRHRAEDLKIKHLKMGTSNKLEALQEITASLGIDISETAFIGDDYNDYGVYKHVGLSVAVPSAPAELLEAADYTTRLPGGRGAVREVIELILKIQNQWDHTVLTVQGNSGQ